MVRPLRIGLLSALLSGGGAERVATNLATFWAQQNHDVTVITISEASSRDYPLTPSVRREALGLSADASNLRAGARANLERIRALRQVFKRLQLDVVLGFCTEPAILAILASWGLNTKVIACEHTYPGSMALARQWQWLRRFTYPRADRVAVLTRDAAQWLQQQLPTARAVVIPNALDFPLPAHEPRLLPEALLPKHSTLVLAVGRLVRLKQFDIALRAFAEATADRPSTLLVILGEGPDRSRLENLVHELGLGDRVLLPGIVGNVGDWYRRARLLVLSSRVEGLPNVLMEALAHGCPAVSFDCLAGPRDIITDGRDGLLVPPVEGIAGLASGIARMLTDDAAHASMSKAALDVRRRFAPERIMQRWQRVLAELTFAAGQLPR